MLRTKNLYERTCTKCNKVFRTDKKTASVCPSCQKAEFKSYRREAEEKSKRKTKEKTLSLRECAAIIEKYNREHKTCYTYGTFPKHLLKEEQH